MHYDLQLISKLIMAASRKIFQDHFLDGAQQPPLFVTDVTWVLVMCNDKMALFVHSSRKRISLRCFESALSWRIVLKKLRCGINRVFQEQQTLFYAYKREECGDGKVVPKYRKPSAEIIWDHFEFEGEDLILL